MTLPAVTPPAFLGSQAFGASETVEFMDVNPLSGGRIITILATATRAGLLHIFRVEGTSEVPHVPPVSMTAIATILSETKVRLVSGTYAFRIRYENTDAGSGTAKAWVVNS